jgi:hypothetical protein
MSRTSRTIKVLAVVVVTAAVVPSVASAQTYTKSAPAAPAFQTVEKQATTLLDQPRQWSRAAGLFEQAAALRAAEDPTGVQDLLVAAGAYRWSGHKRTARAVYVQAAERALAMGDVDTGARAFLLAAIVAQEQKDLAAAKELNGRARLLAASPLLTDGQRRLILGQFEQANAAVASTPAH